VRSLAARKRIAALNFLAETFLITLVATALIFLGWWLLIASEGVYLGRRVVIWLYDIYAHRYDAIKNYRQEYEHMFLAQPIMQKIIPITDPLILDVATGTGRLPLAMLHHAHFEGHIFAVDLSWRMLKIAAEKLDGIRDVTLLLSPAETLPFPDDLFDVVTCLEALEFMTSPENVLEELVRVLRPGGLLLITNRISTKLMPGKTWTNEQLMALMEKCGVEDVQIEIWQADYNKVWGWKKGDVVG
jgi:ubiquinone/menaquinone biosynthesis C-methylase UbiE